jgi:two-component system sensor histidine kinase KdpD
MTRDGRPDPEALLRRLELSAPPERPPRGRLRVLLGSAPGVGKTYAMLREGRRLREAGQDVAIGLVETHGRAETSAQVGDLEIVPPRTVDYRDLVLTELDVEAILARRPQVVLIDELAHTNAPGSPREKRWEDVEAIRDAGIDVIATLNIQHLDSLNHVVESITGVAVRETVPDRIVTESEVQLVDLPVEALLERLETGKIYPAERAVPALRNFFRAGNLTALRELALRFTAAGVDDRLEGYMRGHEIDGVWPAAERVVALIPDHPRAGQVIRAAWRIASGLRAELIAVAVAPTGGLERMPGEARTRLQRQLDLAEDLGATTRVVEGRDNALAVAGEVRRENATTVVLGYEVGGRWQRDRTKLIDQLFAALDHVELHLIELPRVD